MNTKRRGISESLREQILERDAYICAYCDGIATCVDHVVPYAYSRCDDPLNLVASCTECNLIASDKIFDDFIFKRSFIRAQRMGKKWKVKLENQFSFCTECGKPFVEGHCKATHFICKNCNKSDLEWHRKLPKRIKSATIC